MKDILYAIFFLSLFSIILSLKCGFNKIKKPKITKLPYNNPTNSNTKLRRISSRPIEIYVDYEILEADVEKGNITQEYLNNVKEAFDLTINAFKKYLTVKQTSEIIINIGELDNILEDFSVKDIPNLIKNYKKLEKDLYLVPYIFDIEGIDAAAYPLLIDSETNRPVFGGIMLGTHYSFSASNSIRYLAMLFLHEISHILAFNINLFDLFLGVSNPTMNVIVNGIERTLLKTPKVVEFARGHFGCPSLIGVELENQGGEGSAGSHWEARLMLGDYMISTDYNELVVSDISLAIFEDSGWYEVNYYTGGLFKTGKGEGCNFLQLSCINENETSNFPLDFCSEKGIDTCSPSLIDRGICYLEDSLDDIPLEYLYFNNNYTGFEPSDYCPISIYYDDDYYLTSRCDIHGIKKLPDELYEDYGPNNFCFQSSLLKNNVIDILSDYKDVLTARCYKITECNINTLSYSVEIDSGINSICSEANETKKNIIDGYDGYFICPPYWRVCGGTVLCNDPFECLDKLSITQIKDTYRYVVNKTEYTPKEETEEVDSKNLFCLIDYNLWILVTFILCIL